MANFKATLRKKTEKTNHLKKDGFVPAAVYGGDLDETQLVKLDTKQAMALLKTKAKGNRLVLDIDGTTRNLLFKNYTIEPVSGRIMHMEFLQLVKGKDVKGEALVVLKNRELVTVAVQQMMDSIPHRAVPSQLVESVEIDLNGLKEGTIIRVADLPIAKNENVALLVHEDDIVVQIVDMAAKRDVESELVALGEAAEESAAQAAE
jgi:large subunit ribosomal protein L25